MLASLPAAPVPARDYPMVAEPALSSACDSQLRKRKRLSLPPTPPLAADDAGHDCKRLKSFCVEPDCCDHVGEIVDADGDEGDGGDGNDVGNGDGDSDKESGDEDDKFLHRATRVLNSAVASLALTTRLYESDRRARRSLRRAITIIADATSSAARTLPRSPTSDGSGSKGKLLVSGVGKSGHIARKAAATAASVGVRSIFLNAAEAVHGDLGYVSEDDILLLVTFSGRTPELLALLPHIPTSVPVLAITGYCDVDQGTAAGQAARSREQAITDIRPDTIILPAPVSQPESILYGVPAPTTSTTVALAVIDMLVMAVAERIHEGNTATLSACFAKNHPGGAIGAATKQHGALLL